jgi:hypothetical protein
LQKKHVKTAGPATSQHNPIECQKGMKALAKALALLQSLICSGRDLYREKNEKDIEELSLTMVARHGGAAKQKALKQLWDRLDDDEQESYENEARNAIDIHKYLHHTIYCTAAHLSNRNQEDFPHLILEAVKALCQCGHLGPMEMFVMYGFLEKDGNVASYA